MAIDGVSTGAGAGCAGAGAVSAGAGVVSTGAATSGCGVAVSTADAAGAGGIHDGDAGRALASGLTVGGASSALVCARGSMPNANSTPRDKRRYSPEAVDLRGDRKSTRLNS